MELPVASMDSMHYALGPIHVTSRHPGALDSAALRAALVVALTGAGALFCGPNARADGQPLDGAWNMSAVTETFTVQQWSAPCGPPPVSRTTQAAGPATVRAEGDELVIDTSGRTYRTDQCLDPMTTLARDTHSSDGRTWRTRCSTPRSDPRRAAINSAYFLTGDSTLSVAETGRYEFTIEGAHCIADVGRQATLHRASKPPPSPSPDGVSVAPSASSVENTAAPGKPGTGRAAPVGRPDCSAPGDAARLEVRPSRKLLRVGDTFAFGAKVLDASGCPTGTSIRWSVGAVHSSSGPLPSIAPSIDSAGRLTIPGGGDLSDGSFDVIATANGRSARASVEVTSAARYEALLARSGLDPNGERVEPAVAVLTTSSLGGSNVQAEDNAHHRRFLFIGIIAGLAFLLGVVAVLAALRGRRARALEHAARTRHAEKMRDYEATKQMREQEHAAQMRAHLESVARAQQQTADAAARGTSVGLVFCPSCRREFSGGGGGYCPFDANRLVSVAGHEALVGGPSGGICPTCHRGFNPGVSVCPHDGDELAPAAMMAPRPVATRGKICPTCGGRFDGTAAFCGKDGTQLVLLN